MNLRTGSKQLRLGPPIFSNTGTVATCLITNPCNGQVSLTFNVSTTVHAVLLHKAHQLKSKAIEALDSTG